MSLEFSNTDNLRGLVQKYEREIGANRGDISGNTNRLKEFTADANLAMDDYVSMMIQASGTWKGDDTNHTDYPEIYTDIVSGQRDYTFLTDENGNMILDIYKVYLLDGGAYKLLSTHDVDTEQESSTFSNGQNATGTASKYDKTTNAIRLDLTPTAGVTDGLKVSINREGSYFNHTDTTKKPGFPGVHHKYFYLKPAHEYARINGLSSFNDLDIALTKMDRKINEYFDRRAKDENTRLSIFTQNNR